MYSVSKYLSAAINKMENPLPTWNLYFNEEKDGKRNL